MLQQMRQRQSVASHRSRTLGGQSEPRKELLPVFLGPAHPTHVSKVRKAPASTAQLLCQEGWNRRLSLKPTLGVVQGSGLKAGYPRALCRKQQVDPYAGEP